jgi:NAD dependent epimerase/dehydratase family enzyme
LVAPNPLTNAEFIQSIGRAVRRPTWLPLPEFALRLLVGDLATVLVDGQRAIPTGLVDAGFDFNYPTLEEAMQALV